MSSRHVLKVHSALYSSQKQLMKQSSAIVDVVKNFKKLKNRKELILTACLLSTLKKSDGFPF